MRACVCACVRACVRLLFLAFHNTILFSATNATPPPFRFCSDYVNMVLDDVTEYGPDGFKTTMDEILLNGNNIAVLVPGGEGPEDSMSKVRKEAEQE